MDKEHLLKSMRAERFKRNNGKVMLAINILRHDYISLVMVLSVLEKSEHLSEGEFLDSVHFLHGNGYIHLRTISAHAAVVAMAGSDYKRLEAIVTQDKGVRLLADELSDKAVMLEW